MKFGVRECADVVFRAKTAQRIGKKTFYKDEPVIYFDTLKTSSLEGAATTVYAQGGRGNPRLMSWDGERTVTFTMEDALISPVGLSILSGAGLIDAEDLSNGVIAHITERTAEVDAGTGNEESGTAFDVYVAEEPYTESGSNTIYIMKLNEFGEVDSEPIIGDYADTVKTSRGYKISVKTTNYTNAIQISDNETVLVDYYTAKKKDSMEINITPDKFGGAFYMEASTLWRDQGTQKDYAAEFIIPNLRVQSNFTFSMASSGDPSSFTFTCDAFPDYTRFDKTKKVLAQIQILGASVETKEELKRISTNSLDDYDSINDQIERGQTNVVLASQEIWEVKTNTEKLNFTPYFVAVPGEGYVAGDISYKVDGVSVTSGLYNAPANPDFYEITASCTFTPIASGNEIVSSATMILKVVAESTNVVLATQKELVITGAATNLDFEPYFVTVHKEGYTPGDVTYKVDGTTTENNTYDVDNANALHEITASCTFTPTTGDAITSSATMILKVIATAG